MILLPCVAGQTFLVLGFGKSGQASAAALKASGAEALVWDDREAAREKAAAEGFSIANIKEMNWKSLAGLVAAPGIPLRHPPPPPPAE